MILGLVPCLVGTPLQDQEIRSFFRASLDIEGRSYDLMVTLDQPDSYFTGVSGSGTKTVVQGKFQGQFRFYQFETADEKQEKFFQKNKLSGVIGTDNIGQLYSTFDLTSGKVTFSTMPPTKKRFIPGFFNADRFWMTPSSTAYPLTSDTFSQRPATEDDTVIKTFASTETDVFASISPTFEIFTNGTERVISLDTFASKQVTLSPKGIYTSATGDELFTRIAFFMQMWLENVDGYGLIINPYIGRLPVGLKPGDTILEIEDLNLRSGGMNREVIGDMIYLIQSTSWKVKLIRQGKRDAELIQINRTKLYDTDRVK